MRCPEPVNRVTAVLFPVETVYTLFSESFRLLLRAQPSQKEQEDCGSEIDPICLSVLRVKFLRG